jgi:hypothetical protein
MYRLLNNVQTALQCTDCFTMYRLLNNVQTALQCTDCLTLKVKITETFYTSANIYRCVRCRPCHGSCGLRHTLQTMAQVQFQAIRDGIFDRKLVTGTILTECFRLP